MLLHPFFTFATVKFMEFVSISLDANVLYVNNSRIVSLNLCFIPFRKSFGF